MPSPHPIMLDGGPNGLLLIHGFTGSPTEWHYFAPYFHQQDYTVAAIQLPGHGTTAADLNTKTWQDWTGHHADRCQGRNSIHES